jgi:release factor glutamine methyltransferase
MQTIDSFLAKARKLLAASSETAALDANLLLAAAMAVDRTYLLVHGDSVIPAAALERAESLVARRKNGEPIAYLVGHREFWRGDFATRHKVLVPRQDSESVIELVHELFRRKNQQLFFADLGSGSGCLGSSILGDYPNARALCIDVSQQAILATRLNCDTRRATLLLQSWHKRIPCNQKLHFIVCNPPYIRSSDLHDLVVRRHEPLRALNGGLSGLEEFAAVMDKARTLLRSDGVLIFEIGAGQKLRPLAKQYGFKQIAAKTDLAGRERAVGFGLMLRQVF